MRQGTINLVSKLNVKWESNKFHAKKKSIKVFRNDGVEKAILILMKRQACLNGKVTFEERLVGDEDMSHVDIEGIAF